MRQKRLISRAKKAKRAAQIREREFVWASGVGLMEIPRKERKMRMAHFQQYDILNSGFEQRRSVCVLAPGFTAADDDTYKDITARFIIAVNGAGLIPLPDDRKPDMWLVTDNECTKTDWFQEIDQSFEGIKVFSTMVCAVYLPAPYSAADALFKESKFFTVTIHGKAELDGETFIPMEGIFRPDITVSGTAMRIAQLCGAKSIQLCGVDMQGNLYWNGKERGLPQYANAPLDSRDRLDSCIRWMRKQGVEIYSLSDSALEEV